MTPAPGPLRRLGATDVAVHPLCLGGNVFGWTTDRRASHAVLDAYHDAGGNFVDTADTYSTWVPGHRGGESETIIGAWLATTGRRDATVIATKVGSGADGLAPGLRREQVLAGCEASLRRLGTDRIDLYYAHEDDPETPLAETLGAFDELVRAGKVLHVGVSNFTAERLEEALATCAELGLAAPVALQPRLNLVDRGDLDPALAAACRRHGLGIAVYSALGSGFLTGKYRPDGETPASARAGDVASRYLADPRALVILEAATAVAERRGCTVAQVAIAWAVAQPGVTAAIASATSADQLRELIGGATLELGADDLAELDRAG